MILAAAMLLRHSLALEAEASAIEQAVEHTLADGLRTPDLAAGAASVGTAAMGQAVASRVAALFSQSR
jgi:3-isopropylmalate dehydrogenase